MEGFSDHFTELSVPPQTAGVVGTFKCTCYLYIILSTTVSFFYLQDAILFLQGLIFSFLCVHFVCVMCLTSFDRFF